jgi:hypothetical protein
MFLDGLGPTLPPNCGAGKHGADTAPQALCIAERLAERRGQRQDRHNNCEETPP